VIRIIYNLLAPLLLAANWKRVNKERLKLPDLKGEGDLCWIHAISVGETKAARAFAKALKARDPKCQVVISSVTKTGHKQAKQSLPELDGHFLLPLDTPRLMKALVAQLKPKQFFLVETDLWPNLLHYLKKQGTICSLISGKMSARSYRRHKLFPPFARYLLRHFDHICLQSEEHLPRFKRFVNQEIVTGNLKWDNLPTASDMKQSDNFVITVGSTHAGEEKCILEALKDLDAKIYLIPRHPERFPEVAEMVKAYPNTTLIDKMGVLCEYYAASDIAIVGGSFVPGIGGHNIFEPLALGVPVIFGPHMWGQKEMEELALKSGAGISCTAEDLPQAIENIKGKGRQAEKLIMSLKGATKRTLHATGSKQ